MQRPCLQPAARQRAALLLQLARRGPVSTQATAGLAIPVAFSIRCWTLPLKRRSLVCAKFVASITMWITQPCAICQLVVGKLCLFEAYLQLASKAFTSHHDSALQSALQAQCCSLMAEHLYLVRSPLILGKRYSSWQPYGGVFRHAQSALAGTQVPSTAPQHNCQSFHRLSAIFMGSFMLPCVCTG